MLKLIKKELQSKANKKKAKIYQGFFKTKMGEYGEGDVFLGLTVPEQRRIAKKYYEIELNDLNALLKSKIHEERLTALLILVDKYKKDKENVFNFYLKNLNYVNNWDLVDLTSNKIAGDFLLNKEKEVLYKLAKSDNLWERRVAIVSTFEFIKYNQFEDTLKIAEILLKDKHDLIHKAVGWMLREVGKKDLKKEEEFLNKYYKEMPRTMLRYAIEKFEENKRNFYMKR